LVDILHKTLQNLILQLLSKISCIHGCYAIICERRVSAKNETCLWLT